MQKELKIMIVEDQAEVREGLSFLISSSEGFLCVAACCSAEEALEKLAAVVPDIILMDINLPGMSGTECVVHVKKRHSEIQIMMLTVFENTEDIFRSLEAGASGYLLKKTTAVKLVEAIRDLANGGSPMSSEIARKVVERFHHIQSPKFPEANLSAREEEVLILLAKGFLYKEIASSLFISTETVRSHVHRIYSKLHVRTRSEMLLKYLK